jgi:hypothetical protein
LVYLAQSAYFFIWFFSAPSAISAVNKKRTDLTAEHAETAEKQNTLAVPGETGIFPALLSALSDLCGEIYLSGMLCKEFLWI